MSVFCIKFSFGFAPAITNVCRMTVCVTRTISQYSGRKHRKGFRLSMQSLINKSTNNIKLLESNLFNNRSLKLSCRSCDNFIIYRKWNYVLTKWTLCAFLWVILRRLNFIRRHFGTHSEAREVPRRNHATFRKRWKFEI